MDDKPLADGWDSLKSEYEVGEIVVPTFNASWSSARILGVRVMVVEAEAQALADGSYREIPGTERWGVYYEAEYLKRDGTPHKGYTIPQLVHPNLIMRNATVDDVLATLQELENT